MAENPTPSRMPYLLAGAAVGGILGVLFAPRPGSENRKALKDWLEETRMKGRRTLQNVRKWTHDFPQKQRVVAAFKAGRDAYNKGGNHHRKAHAPVI